jgi:hypothetical protein
MKYEPEGATRVSLDSRCRNQSIQQAARLQPQVLFLDPHTRADEQIQ